MRVDSVLRDLSFSVKELLLAMDNRLTANENFSPEGINGQVLTSNGPNIPPSYQSLEELLGTKGQVSSVFGRIGDVTAQMGDYQFNQISNKPTTILGYGITDAYTKTEVDALLAALSLDDLDDVVITTPVVKNVLRHNGTEWVNAQLDFSDLSGSIANGQVPESAVTQHEAALSIDWSQLTSVPTTLAGYGITDAYTKSETDTLLAAKADSATTLAGYGITDAYTDTEVDALLDALTAADIAPGTFPTGASKYIFDPSTGFDTPFEISITNTCFWGFTLRSNVSGSAWVGGFQMVDTSGVQYGSFAKAASADSDIYLQSYQGGFRFWARSGSIVFAPGGTTTKWTMDSSTFDLVAATGAMLRLVAGTTSKASLRIPHGSAPTSPTNGDIWTTTAGLFVRINGVTVGPLS